MKEYTLKLSAAQIEIIAQQLASGPYAHVAGVIETLRQQIGAQEAQSQKAAMPPLGPDAPRRNGKANGKHAPAATA